MSRLTLATTAFITIGMLAAVLHAQAPKTDAEARTLRAENAMLKSQVATLKKKVADLSAVRGENAVLQKQVAELSLAVKAASDKMQGLLKELASVRAAVTSRPAQANVVAPATKPAVKPRPGSVLSVTQGGIRIDLVAAVIDLVPLKNEITDRTGRSQAKLLQLTVRVTNLSSTKKLNYRTWGATSFEFTNAFSGALSDDLKNAYKRIEFSGANVPVGRCKRESIYPEKSIQDILVFEIPVAKAKQLILLLPLKNVGGGDGIAKLVIPMKGVEK